MNFTMVLNSYTLSIYKEQGPFLSVSNREVKMLTVAEFFLLFSFTPVNNILNILI